MITDKQVTKAKEVIMKYLLPDCLKPQYDGKFLSEIVKEMLQAVQDQDNEDMVNEMFKDVQEQEERHEPLDKAAEQVEFKDIKI